MKTVAQREQFTPQAMLGGGSKAGYARSWARMSSPAGLGASSLSALDEDCAHLTVATRFLRNWLRSHYYDFVLRLLRAEWAEVDRIEFRVRQPHFGKGAAEGGCCARSCSPMPSGR